MSIKRLVEKIKELYEELEHEWFVYTCIRRFARLDSKKRKEVNA